MATGKEQTANSRCLHLSSCCWARDVHLFIGLQGFGWDPIQNHADAYATGQSLREELVVLQ